MSSDNSTTQQQPQQSTESSDEPTIVFVFELKKWYETINPLTKVELVDIAPIIGYQFFFDAKANGYVLVVVKSKWDATSFEARRRFMTISRRIKEEIEGAMLTTQRDLYESSDLFELFGKQAQAPAPGAEQLAEDLAQTTVVDTTAVDPTTI